MKTVQMTLDEKLVEAVDRAARRLRTSRSAFTRRALKAALTDLETRELERRHRDGYLSKPPRKGEFDVWESEHAWGDE
jgi:metal-responsive CopG/Arc/MetJ family transcriptional regulator